MNYPKKLKQLKDMFWIEAAKFNVLPLDDRGMPDRFLTPRPGTTDGRTHFSYPDGMTRLPSGSAPDVKNCSATPVQSQSK